MPLASDFCGQGNFRVRKSAVLIIVRHGQTDANARGVLLGREDPALDAVGRAQASAVAAALAPLPGTTRVVSSPLRRTRQTAGIISPDVVVEIDERWIELDYGVLEHAGRHGLPDETAWRRWRTDPDFAPEGGETLRALGQRVAEACVELLAEAIDEDAIVVTHVSPVKAAVVWALCVGDEATWRTYVAPASITRITNRRHGPVLVSFNETPWSVVAKVGSRSLEDGDGDRYHGADGESAGWPRHRSSSGETVSRKVGAPQGRVLARARTG